MSDAKRRIVTSDGDIAYVRREFRIAAQLDPTLPQPSYYDSEGNAYVPRDYEQQERDRDRFAMRARAECKKLGLARDEAWIEEAWQAYMEGLFGICLREATPENIARKEALIGRIEALIAAPSNSPDWSASLRDTVDDLDALERPFCDFDRELAGGTVSRDRYIDAVRAEHLAARITP